MKFRNLLRIAIFLAVILMFNHNNNNTLFALDNTFYSGNHDNIQEDILGAVSQIVRNLRALVTQDLTKLNMIKQNREK